MLIRDAQVLQAALKVPYEGYAVRQSSIVVPDVDRIVALVAVLGTMVLSGIMLGRPRA